VAAIICATSIFNGFREFTENQLIGLDPHIRISAQKGAWLLDADSVISKLKIINQIKAVSPVIQSKLIAVKKSNMKLMLLTGVKPKEFANVSGMQNSIIVGNFFLKDKFQRSYLVIGAGLADDLRALPGDSISVMTFGMIENSMKTMSANYSCTLPVSGVFQSHNADYDFVYAYTDFENARKIMDFPENSASSIDIRLSHIEDVPEVVKKIGGLIPDLTIQTWYDFHKDLYNVMQLERIAVFVILSLIVVLAIFNVLASISMTVIEKRKDIGVLMAIGATKRHIMGIYLKEGILIGALGTFTGTIIGLLLCWSQLKFGWYTMSGAKYLISAIPVSVHITDIVAVVLMSLVMSFVSGYFPAKFASNATITESLREE